MYPPTPDPAPLYAFADAISSQADVLRVRARHLVTVMSTMRWSSSSATVFRMCADDITRAMLREAWQLDGVSELLRRHAARVAAFVPRGTLLPPGPVALSAPASWLVPAGCR